MASGRPARAATGRPNRLVFRPFYDRPAATSSLGNVEHATQQQLQLPINANLNVIHLDNEKPSESISKPSESQDYGIDFELDDEDAEAIELVFAEHNRKLNQKVTRESAAVLPASETLQALNQPSSTTSNRQDLQVPLPKKEEELHEQEDYHDSLALDSLLDLEYDDAELVAAFVSQELPSSQQSGKQQKLAAIKESAPPKDEWDIDEDIDRQVILEYEQWLQKTGYEEVRREDGDVIDETPDTLEKKQLEDEKRKAYNEALEAGEPLPIEQITDDTRSPLERFRRTGKKTKLSVSDLLSNMWCEQQFHYTLLLGFKRETAEMQAGTKIHRKMEEEVHTVVPVTVKTRQDKWGVRIWNMIQGMESLRTTGLTRELEVWGWIDGVFINGVIDEVTFTKYQHKQDDEGGSLDKLNNRAEGKEISLSQNVTEAMVTTAAPTEEAPIAPPKTPKKRGRPRKNPPAESPESTPSKKQTMILDFMTPSPSKPRTDRKPAYILDLKTRFVPKIPEPGSSQSKSVHLQLMLYRKLLNEMIKARAGSMVKKLCAQHNILENEPFSDHLIAEWAELFEGSKAFGTDTFELVLEHNTLGKLYSFYHEKLKETIKTIAPDLTVVYRWQRNGEFLDSAGYQADDDMLEEHVDSVISWWKGKRATVGVEIEDAWKCKKCEFAEDCTWRLSKIEEAMQTMRDKRRAAM
ncbi:hypothetical protein ABW19_dt0207991 [Dactylella cylindrospora]|nr:hypothetical protein ABW19_dt0207991 [Dactylella cylindrospora]